MPGVIMYPREMLKKTRYMQEQLEKMNSSTGQALAVLAMPEENFLALRGRAWDSVRSYISRVQLPLMELYRLWIEEQKAATASYERAADRLPRVRCLDQDELDRMLRDYERRLDREYDREHPSRYRIARYTRMIREITQKLEAMESFLAATRGIYGEALRLQEILGRADTQLKGVSGDVETGTIDYTCVSNEWLLELGEEAAAAYLLKEGILTKENLKNLDNMGFTAAEIRAVYQVTEGEEDRALITGLLKADYRSAFQANSSEITPPAQLFLSEYMLRISMADHGDEKLEKIMNGIVEPERDRQYPAAGHLGSNTNAWRYLEKLYAGTTNILELESALLYGPEALEEGMYERLVERNEKLMALATLYGSQYEVIEMAKKPGANYIADLSEIAVSGLSYDEHTNCYEYTMRYEGLKRYVSIGGETGGEEFSEVRKVSTEILETQNGVTSQMLQEKRRELVEAQEKLGGKLVGDMMGEGGAVYLSSIHPALGAAAGLLAGMAGGNLEAAYGGGIKAVRARDWMENGTARRVFADERAEIPGKALSALQNYYRQQKALEEGIKELDEYTRMSWFGMGGAYRIDGGDSRLVVSGVYSPEVIRRIGVWEEKGLEGLIEYLGGETVEMDGKVREDFEDPLTEEEKLLWFGGDILGMDISSLDAAAATLEESYQKNGAGPINIKDLLSIKGDKIDGY